MHCTTVEELRAFLARSKAMHKLELSTEGDGSLFFVGHEASCVSLPWPTHPLEVRYTSRLAAMIDIDEEGLFYGGTLWISLTDIGSTQLEKSGWRMVERMRAAFGEMRPLEVAPVHHFRADELVDLTAFIVPCFVYGWNAFYLNSSHDTFVFISHDEWWCVVTRNPNVRDQLLQIEGASEDERALTRFVCSS